MKLPRQYIYPYGKFSDTPVAEDGDERKSGTLIVYTYMKDVSRPISSLEGLFVCEKELITNPLCQRNEMKEFEEMHKGKFLPFNGI